MAKKEIKRNIKRNTKSSSSIESVEDNFNKFVTTVAGIIILLIISYLIIGVFFTKEIDFKKDKDKEEEKTTVTVDNSKITAGQIFDKKDESYYVVIYDVDSKLTNIGTFISLYSSSENSIPVYTVDSKNKMNSKFIVEDNSNTSPNSYDDLRIKEPTLIKIEGGKVTSYIENEEEIKSILKNE